MAYLCEHSPHYHAVYGMCETYRKFVSERAGRELTAEEAEVVVQEHAVEFAIKALTDYLGVTPAHVNRTTEMLDRLLKGEAPVGRQARRLKRWERAALRDAVWMSLGDALGSRRRAKGR